ncbi:MAG: site-2 protease family protein [Gammaproteobacteria bacterium]|nr:site-2 protease family protein [Gammaproteobacteria bacterium]
MEASLSLVQRLAVWALPVLFAVTLHEVAHGWVARSLGDSTASRLGRLSLNPLKHIDPVGTILLPALLLLVGGFLFGWAKPVPVDARNFRHPRRDMAIVAVAGPLANLAMALAWGLLLRYSLLHGADAGTWLGIRLMASAGVMINVALMVFNLLPLPPLDGGRVVAGLLPAHAAYRYSRIEPYGIMIVLGFFVLQSLFPALGLIIAVPMYAVQNGIVHVLGLQALM